MVAQATAVEAGAASGGGSGVASLLSRAARRPAAPGPSAGGDPDRLHLLHVIRLYRLVLQRLPDRPGLRHHADLLLDGSTLAELAASLLAVSRSAGGNRKAAARVLWSRAGGGPGFEAAWVRASGLADFAAELVRHPLRRDDGLLPALFPDGIDPALADAGPAWAYRLWAGEIDTVLDRLARRVLGMLRVLGPRIVLTLTLQRDTRVDLLDASLGSLSRQLYGRWRVRLEGEAPIGWSPPADPRIAWPAPVASRPVVPRRPVLDGVLRPGEVLSPSCLAMFALAALRRPLVSGWCCDEDLVDADGLRVRPRLHRDGGLVLRRRPSRPGRDNNRHLPAALLHRPLSRPAASVESAAVAAQGLPAASLVIVTRDRPVLLRRCLDSIRATTGAPGSDGAPEIVIVDNGTTDPDALLILDRCAAEGCVVLRRPGAFNWSALCNQGVRASTGAVVVLLNNDVDCIRPGWLPCLLVECLDPAVGVVGATLLFADGRVQHNGVLVGSMPGRGRGLRPVAAHRLDAADAPGAPSRAASAVTGACMAFRRDLFDRLGGLEEALPVTWNDLDFCFRAREAGFSVRVATGCVLRHDELGTRTPDTAPENLAQLARTLAFVAGRHRRMLGGDRFLHPFLLFASGARLLDPSAPARIVRLLARGGIACEAAAVPAGRLD